MKWFIILLIFPLSSFACDKALKVGEKLFKVCVEESNIFSKGCNNVPDCFTTPKHLKYYPNQSPLFSLCYQSDAKPHFAKLSGNKDKVEVCVTEKGSVVDLDSLMKSYQKSLE